MALGLRCVPHLFDLARVGDESYPINRHASLCEYIGHTPRQKSRQSSCRKWLISPPLACIVGLACVEHSIVECGRLRRRPQTRSHLRYWSRERTFERRLELCRTPCPANTTRVHSVSLHAANGSTFPFLAAPAPRRVLKSAASARSTSLSFSRAPSSSRPPL
jgi:hypothetical protein